MGNTGLVREEMSKGVPMRALGPFKIKEELEGERTACLSDGQRGDVKPPAVEDTGIVVFEGGSFMSEPQRNV